MIKCHGDTRRGDKDVDHDIATGDNSHMYVIDSGLPQPVCCFHGHPGTKCPMSGEVPKEPVLKKEIPGNVKVIKND